MANSATKRMQALKRAVGYNPDSFGHTGGLPQILKLQGLNEYVFMRPNAIEKPAIHQNLFEWQGIDGTRMLTFRIPLFYDDPAAVRNHMEREIVALTGQPERTAMEFFGVGDHGGGPTKENMRSIRQIQKEQGAPHIFYSTPDRFFAEVASHLPADIQVYTGDLQHHSVGTYTAGSDIKKLNRTTEVALQTAEKFAAIGLAAGDSIAADIVAQTGRRLGEALAILVDLLNPERIVVGGLALRLGEALLAPARAQMHAEALSASAVACSVLPAALGESIGDAAALCVAMGLHNA